MWTRKNLDFTKLFHKSTSDHKYYMNFYYYNRKERPQKRPRTYTQGLYRKFSAKLVDKEDTHGKTRTRY